MKYSNTGYKAGGSRTKGAAGSYGNNQSTPVAISTRITEVFSPLWLHFFHFLPLGALFAWTLPVLHHLALSIKTLTVYAMRWDGP